MKPFYLKRMKLSKLIALLLFILFFINCSNKQKPKNQLAYTIYNEELTEKPSKTQIITDIVINQKDSITAEKLESLLNQLYEERMNRDGFQYREHPNCVAIYAYLSKERVDSGASQWIAMIAKMPMDSVSKISFNDAGLHSLSEKKEIKWNLSYKKRKQIWDRIIFAEREGQIQADKAIPIVAGITAEEYGKNANWSDKVKKVEENKIIKDFKITRVVLDSVGMEGIYNDWAFPKR